MLQKIVREKVFSVLDIGTSKVCCLIARADTKGNVQIIGQGIAKTNGFRSGKIVSLEELTTSIRAAVDMAESALGEAISKVCVNVSLPSLRSQYLGAEIKLAPYAIGTKDINRALKGALSQWANEGEEILHRIALSYSIDGDDDKSDPRGMTGSMLGVVINVISAHATPLRNLDMAVQSSYLATDLMVATPLAASMAVLSAEECELGATLIDIGAGMTSIAVIDGGKVKYVSALPVGGGHITNDIAKGLAISRERAEEIKTLYGRTYASADDERETINVIPVGESEDMGVVPIPKAQLVAIIQPRVLEILEMVKDRLKADDFYDIPSRRVVITGGASSLQGMKEAAAFVLDGRQIRIGYPLMDNLPSNLNSPAFATAVGLIKYALEAADDEQKQDAGLLKKTEKFGRIGKWFLQSF